jgi:hypothetical protein
LHERVFHSEKDERDQRDASDAVSLESIGAWPYRVAGVIAGAVGDYAGVARVVLLDFENNLHQVRADVSNLGKDATRDA